MKINASFLLPILLVAFVMAGCEEKLSTASCHAINIDKPFTAMVGEQWCINENDWKITFGPIIEDSRCNVPGLECVWAGRFVMAATIESGEISTDTFYAVNNWQDTIYNGPYRIILDKVFPEQRTSMETLDSSAYSFRIIVQD
jgi:hypothetical protein